MVRVASHLALVATALAAAVVAGAVVAVARYLAARTGLAAPLSE